MTVVADSVQEAVCINFLARSDFTIASGRMPSARINNTRKLTLLYQILIRFLPLVRPKMTATANKNLLTRGSCFSVSFPLQHL